MSQRLRVLALLLCALLFAPPRAAADDMGITPLHNAVSAGNVELVKDLLEKGAEVNAQAYNEFTPIHFAKDPKIINLLADHKADLNAESAAGTPLQNATLRLLPNSNWQPNALPDDDTSDYTKKGRAIAEALICAGARYDILSAARLGDLDRVKTIVRGDGREALNKAAMRDAARCGHAAIVQFLLDNKGDPNDADFGGMPVLYFALNRPEVVKVLIKGGADVKSPLKDTRTLATGRLPDGCTILHEAAKVGVTETARLLIEAGVEVDARDPSGVTALQYAAWGGCPEMVKLLHQHKASIKGDDGVKALRVTVSHIYYAEQTAEEIDHYKAVIAYLIKEGVPVDLRTAVVLGDLQQVKKLVKQNAFRDDKPTRYEKPLLQLAVGLNQKDIVSALLDGGASVAGVDDSGYTALHAAGFWGRAEIAKILIDRGAKVDARTVSGYAPLSEAARCGHIDTARVLIAAGADVNAKEKNGRTPLGCSSDKAMIEFLKMNGGK